MTDRRTLIRASLLLIIIGAVSAFGGLFMMAGVAITLSNNNVDPLVTVIFSMLALAVGTYTTMFTLRSKFFKKRVGNQ